MVYYYGHREGNGKACSPPKGNCSLGGNKIKLNVEGVQKVQPLLSGYYLILQTLLVLFPHAIVPFIIAMMNNEQ